MVLGQTIASPEKLLLSQNKEIVKQFRNQTSQAQPKTQNTSIQGLQNMEYGGFPACGMSYLTHYIKLYTAVLSLILSSGLMFMAEMALS